MKHIQLFRSLPAVIVVLLCLWSCDENKRFEIGYDDTIPPSPPVYVDYKPLYGGATLFFEVPEDKDLLSIDATYLNQEGKETLFSVSYYTDSINVLGFSEATPQKVQLFATDRAGNRSQAVTVMVTPLQPAVAHVVDKLKVKAGFSSMIVEWKNEQQMPINIFVDYEYVESGQNKTGYSIFTSNDTTGTELIRDLDASKITQPVKVKVRVEDRYGNVKLKDMGELTLLPDSKIPKAAWSMPNANDSIGGVPAAYLDAYHGRGYKIYDDVLSNGFTLSMGDTGGYGRTGKPEDGNVPFNIMIDLGDYYELSRIITWQRWTGTTNLDGRMEYYTWVNVGVYRMYYWDDDTNGWEEIREHKITVPLDLPDRQYRILGEAGDMAIMYPDDPHFTKPTRWFRYEALYGFADYKNTNCINLAEITLYGRKAN